MGLADIRKTAAEEYASSCRRMLDRVVRIEERQDGSRIYFDRKTGAVLGVTPARPATREEPNF